jgi:hypothetical protein
MPRHAVDAALDGVICYRRRSRADGEAGSAPAATRASSSTPVAARARARGVSTGPLEYMRSGSIRPVISTLPPSTVPLRAGVFAAPPLPAPSTRGSKGKRAVRQVRSVAAAGLPRNVGDVHLQAASVGDERSGSASRVTATGFASTGRLAADQGHQHRPSTGHRLAGSAVRPGTSSMARDGRDDRRCRGPRAAAAT